MRSNVFEAFISGQSPGKTSEFPRSGKTSEIGLQVIDLNN